MRSSVTLPLLALLVLVIACGARTTNTGNDAGGPRPDLTFRNDPNYDNDGDKFTPLQGDCDDTDNTIYPGAPELCDLKDHNCNLIHDDSCDDDHDGFAAVAGNGLPGGDCDDHDPFIGPESIEVAANLLDDNCNGMTDEAPPACPTNLAPREAPGLAAAIELCAPWLLSATFNVNAYDKAKDTKLDFGLYMPQSGPTMAVLSTGIAADATDPGFTGPQPGTDFGKNESNPLPQMSSGTCGQSQPDESTVHDLVELKLTLKVPRNAKSFSFKLNFMSSEYPEYVGSDFNDKFLAILDSTLYKGNVSFDQKGNPITINAGFFAVCEDQLICMGAKLNKCAVSYTQLTGTGFEETDSMLGTPYGGGTGWLTTTAPATPGETLTLRFIIFDEKDHNWDSTVLLDSFQWGLVPTAGPVTVQ